MSYYVSSKVVRETLGQCIIMMQKNNKHLDHEYMQKLMAGILQEEVFILRDHPQSKSEREMFNDK